MANMRLSVIIPSAKDPCLQKTIDDLRAKAGGEIEIVAVLDGTFAEVNGAETLFNERRIGLRGSVNRGVEASSGKYLLKTDAHCVFDKDFDLKLLAEIEDNWVVSPMRYKLDTEKWEVMPDAPIVYERIAVTPDKLHGVQWVTRTRERKNILVDENMVFQGSCWVMSREHWDRLGGLQEKGDGTFAQEPMEIALKTWLGGGKVMINKNTWYAHKHRKFKRTMGLDGGEIKQGNTYSREFWLNNQWAERKHDFDWLMKRFSL